MDGYTVHVRTCVKEGAVEIKDHGGDLVRRSQGRRTLGRGGRRKRGAESMGGMGRKWRGGAGDFKCARRKRPLVAEGMGIGGRPNLPTAGMRFWL